MDTLEEWWPTIGEWLSRTTLAVGAIVGVFGLTRALVEVSRKKRLRRALERNLRIFAEIPSQRAKEGFERLVNTQASELLMLEGTPYLRRRGVRFIATLTFASLAIAGLAYSPDSENQRLTTLIQYASLGTIVILATHMALRVLSRLVAHADSLRNLPDKFVRFLDRIAEDGLIRLLAWRLGYAQRPTYSIIDLGQHEQMTSHLKESGRAPAYEIMDLRPQEYATSSLNERIDRRLRLSEVVEYLRTGI